MFSKILLGRKNDAVKNEVTEVAVGKQSLEVQSYEYKELYEKMKQENEELKQKCTRFEAKLKQSNSIVAEQETFISQLEDSVTVFKEVIKSADIQFTEARKEIADKDKRLVELVLDKASLINSRRKSENEEFVLRRELLGLSRVLQDEKDLRNRNLRKLKDETLAWQERNSTLSGQLRDADIKNEILVEKLKDIEQNNLAKLKGIEESHFAKLKSIEQNHLAKFNYVKQENLFIKKELETTSEALNSTKEDLKTERINLFYANQDLAEIKARDKRVYGTLLNLAESIKAEYEKKESKRLARLMPSAVLKKLKSKTTRKSKPYFVDTRFGYVQQLLNDLFC